MNVFAGVFGGSAEKKAGSAGAGVGGALLELTPHKMAMCHLVQVFAPPAQAGAAALPFPFESVAHHNRLGLFLLALTRSCEDLLEPPLEELLRQLKAVDDLVNGWLCEQLTCTLSALTSTDDLFNFFDKLRGVLTPPEGANVEDVFLDPNSQLGVFLRCCILAFNSMTFEGVCHLLANLVVYCSSIDTACDLAEDEDFNSEMEMTNLMDADIGVRAGIFDKYSQGYAAAAESYIGESSSSLIHAPISLHNFDEDAKQEQKEGTPEFSEFPSTKKKECHEHITKEEKLTQNLAFKQFLFVLSSGIMKRAITTLHVRRPLVSFGPNAATKLRTCPADVCKMAYQPQMIIVVCSSWLRSLSAASSSWCSSSTKSTKLLTDNLHFHSQPSPIPPSVLQLAASAYLLRATAWEHYGSSPMVRMNALVYATSFADAARYDNAVLGFPYALASQSFCKSFNLDPLEASATLTLTELWLALGSSHAKRALSLVYQSLPMILGHGGLELRARARIVLAKCHLSDPKFSVWEDPSVLDPLNQTAEDLQALEYHEMAAEAYYLKARAYNHLGKLDEREEAAACFKEHVIALENPHKEEDSLAY